VEHIGEETTQTYLHMLHSLTVDLEELSIQSSHVHVNERSQMSDMNDGDSKEMIMRGDQ